MENQPSFTPQPPTGSVVYGAAPPPKGFRKWWAAIRSFVWPASASLKRKIIVVTIGVVLVLVGVLLLILLSGKGGDVPIINRIPVIGHNDRNGERNNNDNGQDDDQSEDGDDEQLGENGGNDNGPENGGGPGSPSAPNGGEGNTPPPSGGGNGDGNGGNGNGGNGGGDTRCAAYPAVPDASCTGVLPGTSLTTHNGELYITTPGAVIENMEINGCVHIMANNITIRNSKINRNHLCDWAHAINTGYGDYTGTLIEDVEVHGGAPSSPNIAGVACVGVNNYTARRLHVHHCGRAFNMGSNVTIEDSYMHDMYGSGESHNSGIGSNGGTNITVRHNHIICDIGAPGNISPGGGCSGALVLYSDFGPVSATVEYNRFNSYGGYCLLGYAHTSGSSLTIRNNQFGVALRPDCGQYGPVSRITGSAPFTWQNNVWHAPGQSKHGQQIATPPDSF